VNELLGFFHDRLRAMLREKGVRPDVLQASFEHESLDDDMVRLRHKSLALQEYLERPDSEAMLRPVKRLLRLLEGEVGKWPLMMRRHASEKHLRLREEFVLYERLQLQRPVLESCLATESYGDFLLAMEALSEPLEQFLDHVVVQCDDRQLQKNRLCLLLEIQELLTAVWHVSAITMEGVA
jgi:glycyl-tRNA synthetase beta chain